MPTNKMKVEEVMTKNIRWAEIPGSRENALELLKSLGISAIPVVRSGTGEFVGMVSLRRLLENPDEDQLAMLVDREVPTVAPDDELKNAAKLMVEKRLRRLPVLRNGELVGIITVRDIVYRVLTQNFPQPAANFMHPATLAIWDGTPLKAALEIMALAGLRALPVLDSEGILVGIVDDSDIVKVCEVETSSRTSQTRGRTEGDSWTWDTEDRIYITKKVLKVPDKVIRDIMTKNIITITRKTSVSETASLMKEHKIEQVPVISAEGRLCGMVYDIDLLRVLF
jgi:CBS domain-containing protein